MGCSFTGHRTIEIRHRDRIRECLFEKIEEAYRLGCRNFYSGAAIGFDTLAALEVLRYKKTHPDVRLILLIPCIDQDKSWNDEQKLMYKRLKDLADEVEYISNSTYYNGCMQRRNQALVDRCRVLISYVGRTRSGSAQTHRMAERDGKIVYNIFPELS